MQPNKRETMHSFGKKVRMAASYESKMDNFTDMSYYCYRKQTEHKGTMCKSMSKVVSEMCTI